MTADLLFPETEQSIAERIDGEILSLLTGRSGGPFGLVPNDDEKRVLSLLRYMRGLKKAMPIRDIQLKTKLSARSIKDIVRTLRVSFHLPIGSSKQAMGGGYYIMITSEDMAAWGNDLFSQVKAEVAAFRAAAGPEATARLVGQLSLEVRK